MKKAKVILTAVGLLAIVGGALAFKARTTNRFYKTTTPTATSCTVPVDLLLRKTAAPVGTISTNLTDVFAAPTPCSIRVTSNI